MTTPESSALPRRVLIANRGEIAVRIARTCREVGIGTVAVFSDVDVAASHVAACDQAVRLGGASPAESYLRTDAVLAAAARAGADAVHPGYGFLSENAAFARAVEDAGLTWVGPPPDVIAMMGDKVAAKRAMAAAGVPVVPGGELPNGADADDVAARLGYPVLVKAAAGGGGKGMRIVTAPEHLVDAVDAARREAAGAFGDSTVFLERFVPRSRHVEVQILGDAHGAVVHVYERECSIQRRHQKVVEEAPSPGLDTEVRAALCTAAVDAAKAIGYQSAGTVEFIADEDRLAARRAGAEVAPQDTFAFLEVNTRLQVEHPVTEETVQVADDAGRLRRLDLVREQLHLASGAALRFAQDDLVQSGHAIEVRLYAEDPAAGYLPQSGRLHAFAPATGDGIRWDAGVRAGEAVSPHYDPMLAKVIASAPTRAEAASRLARALDDTVLLGVTTNRELLAATVRHPAFLAGDTTTDFLDVHLADGGMDVPDPATVTAAVIAVTVARVHRDCPSGVRASVRPGFASAATFVPATVYDVAGAASVPVRWRIERDGTWSVATDEHDDTGVVAGVDGLGDELRRVTVHELAGPVDDRTVDLEIDGHRQRVRVTSHRGAHTAATPRGRVEVTERDRFPARADEVAPGATLAPMPGAVVTVAVEVGQHVARGDLLCTVEAMKMEHRVTAATDGDVIDVRVTAGQQVDADEVLVILSAPDGSAANASG